MFWIVQVMVPIAIVVVLPVLIVWIIYRATTNRTNKNAEIVIKAIENNSAIDTDKLVDALGKPRKTPREILQLRLLRGCIFTFIGITFAIFAAIMANSHSGADYKYPSMLASGICLAIGIAYLIVYNVTRKSAKDE